ncbi:MAG: class I SAM-dependent methyltransferase [Calditrichia bacterium]
MEIDVQSWVSQEGTKYIKTLGIMPGQVVVDFGCNAGYYAIPAAKVVGAEGTVYAIDKDDLAIKQLLKTMQAQHLDNIKPILSDKPVIDLPAASADAILLYDILHYFDRYDRELLYRSVNTVLKPDGILSVFPKHNQANIPMWHLAELSITDIMSEIERNNFILMQKEQRCLIHDDRIEKAIILNFKNSKIKANNKSKIDKK